MYGYIGLVDYILENMMNELSPNRETIKVIATGGFSGLIGSESKYIKKIDKLLTLDGLRIIYERNRKDK